LVVLPFGSMKIWVVLTVFAFRETRFRAFFRYNAPRVRSKVNFTNLSRYMAS
jgi:hypothetical protein